MTQNVVRIQGQEALDEALDMDNANSRSPMALVKIPPKSVRSTPLREAKKHLLTAGLTLVAVLAAMSPTLLQVPQLLAVGGTDGAIAQLLLGITGIVSLMALLIGVCVFTVLPKIEELIMSSISAASSAEKAAFSAEKSAIASTSVHVDMAHVRASQESLRTAVADLEWRTAKTTTVRRATSTKKGADPIIEHLASAFRSDFGVVHTLLPNWRSECLRVQENGKTRVRLMSDTDIAPSFARILPTSAVSSWRIVFGQSHSQLQSLAIFLWALERYDSIAFYEMGVHLDRSKVQVRLLGRDYDGAEETVVAIPRKSNGRADLEILRYSSTNNGSIPTLRRFLDGDEHATGVRTVEEFLTRSFPVSLGALREWLGTSNVSESGLLGDFTTMPRVGPDQLHEPASFIAVSDHLGLARE